MEADGANAREMTLHVIFLFLNAFLFVALQIQVLGLSLRVPELFEMHFPVLLHLDLVLFPLIFETIVDFSRYANPQTKLRVLEKGSGW